MEDKLTFRNIFWSLAIIASLIVIGSVVKLFLASITIAIFLYYSARPLFNRINRRLKNKTQSAVITLLATFVPLVFLTGYILQLGYTELRSFAGHYDISLQKFISDSFEADISILLTTPTQIIQSQEGVALVQELMDWSVLVVGFVGDIFLRLIVTAVIFYYLLKHDSKLSNWATNNFGTLTPQWTRFWKRVDDDLSNIYFGNILNGIIAMVIAIAIALIYSLFAPDPIDIPYPVLFGIVAGISSLIPIIGVKVAYIPVTLYISTVAYTTEPTKLFPYIIVFVLFCVVILDFLQDLMIRPYISGKNLHIGLLLIAYISGPLILGWYGFFFAPILLVLIYHFSELILPDLIAEWF